MRCHIGFDTLYGILDKYWNCEGIYLGLLDGLLEVYFSCNGAYWAFFIIMMNG
jgi:hypothetical protein